MTAVSEGRATAIGGSLDFSMRTTLVGHFSTAPKKLLACVTCTWSVLTVCGEVTVGVFTGGMAGSLLLHRLELHFLTAKYATGTSKAIVVRLLVGRVRRNDVLV